MLNVVAAVITNKDGKVFIAKRNLKKSQGGLWEFPGGKIEQGETEREAIQRELREELDFDVIVKNTIGSKVYDYADKSINLIAINCVAKNFNYKLIEHEEAKWVKRDELSKYNFAPADMFIVEYLINNTNLINNI